MRVPTGDSSPLTERSQLQLGEGAKRQDRRWGLAFHHRSRDGIRQNVPQTLTLPPTVAQRTVAWLQGAPRAASLDRPRRRTVHVAPTAHWFKPGPAQSALGAGSERYGGAKCRVCAPEALARAWLTASSAAGWENGQHDRRWEGSQNCWGASNSNAGINLNLNPNQPSCLACTWTRRNCGDRQPCQHLQSGQCHRSEHGHPEWGNPAGTVGAWGNLLPQESTGPQTSTSQNVSFSAQPQNLNTDGPNNTNPWLPSPLNTVQTNGLPNWGLAVGMGVIIPPHLQGLPGANGSSVSQVVRVAAKESGVLCGDCPQVTRHRKQRFRVQSGEWRHCELSIKC